MPSQEEVSEPEEEDMNKKSALSKTVGQKQRCTPFLACDSVVACERVARKKRRTAAASCYVASKKSTGQKKQSTVDESKKQVGQKKPSV